MQKELTLTLTADEINLMLEGLGGLPFAKVYGLIAKIQEQATRQLQSENGQVEQALAANTKK